MRLFVGNFAFTTTKDELRQMFEAYGNVEQVRIITDPETGRSRGFGFVEMPDATEAQAGNHSGTACPVFIAPPCASRLRGLQEAPASDRRVR